jgi:hypothetical protein
MGLCLRAVRLGGSIHLVLSNAAVYPTWTSCRATARLQSEFASWPVTSGARARTRSATEASGARDVIQKHSCACACEPVLALHAFRRAPRPSTVTKQLHSPRSSRDPPGVRGHGAVSQAGDSARLIRLWYARSACSPPSITRRRHLDTGLFAAAGIALSPTVAARVPHRSVSAYLIRFQAANAVVSTLFGISSPSDVPRCSPEDAGPRDDLIT